MEIADPLLSRPIEARVALAHRLEILGELCFLTEASSRLAIHLSHARRQSLQHGYHLMIFIGLSDEVGVSLLILLRPLTALVEFCVALDDRLPQQGSRRSRRQRLPARAQQTTALP